MNVLNKRYTDRIDLLMKDAPVDGKENSQMILAELVSYHRTLIQAALVIESLAVDHIEALKASDSDIFPMRYFLSLPVLPPAADALTKELDATLAKYQSDIDKLRAAIIDHPDIPGGFIETVAAHILAMRRGIAQLTVQNVITLARAAEMTGLSLHQARQWASSGNMQRDADDAIARPQVPA